MNRTVGGNLAIGAVVAAALAVSGVALSGWSPSFADATSSVAEPAPTAPPVAARTGSAPASPATSPAVIRPTPTPVPHLPSDRPSTLAVIGDSTSNQLGAWVNVLGEEFGRSRLTHVQRMSQTGTGSYRAPVRYGHKEPHLQVWNASTAAPFAAVAEEQVKQLLPQRPDIVVLSVGRTTQAGAVGEQLSATRSAILKAYPQAQLAVVRQPVASPTQQPAIAAVSAWATKLGVPTIDVAAAFAESQDPGSLEDADGVTDAGARLWAVTVHRALTAQPAASAGVVGSRAGATTGASPSPAIATSTR